MGIKDSMKFAFGKLLEIYRAYRFPLRLEEQLQMMNKRQEMMFWWMMRKENESLRETQKRFFASLPPAEGQLRIVQNALLELLKKFDDFCTANQIVYWLDFGTLIGAVRHHGFVPWDDDLDVCITRKNFYKLCDLIRDNSELQIRYSYFDNSHKYYNSSKIACWAKVFLKNSNPPVWIDFEIYDEVFCNNWQEIEERWKKRCQLRTKCADKLKSRFKKYLFDDFVDDVEDVRFLESVLSECAKQLGDDDGNYLMVGIEYPDDNYNGVKVYPQGCFFPAVPCEFEGRQFPIPHEAEKYLASVYGDIYSLPLNAGSSTHFEELAKLSRQHFWENPLQ